MHHAITTAASKYQKPAQLLSTAQQYSTMHTAQPNAHSTAQRTQHSTTQHRQAQHYPRIKAPACPPAQPIAFHFRWVHRNLDLVVVVCAGVKAEHDCFVKHAPSTQTALEPGGSRRPAVGPYQTTKSADVSHGTKTPASQSIINQLAPGCTSTTKDPSSDSESCTSNLT